MRSLLAKRCQPDHRLGWLGPQRQGLEFGQLQAKGQPPRPQRLLEHRHCFARRFAVRFGWQRRPGHALGLKRQQALVHFGQW